MTQRSLIVVLAHAVAVASLSGCSGGAPQAEAEAALTSYPVSWDALGSILDGVDNPGTPPPGANVSSCVLTALHPDPIVLVHGTFGNQNDNWRALAPYLANAGYCVYTFTFGQTWYSGGLGAVDDIGTSAQQLASFVGRVRSETGASRVVFVGHSQGGMLPRYYARYLGGAAYTKQIVALAASNDSTSVDGIGTLASIFPGASVLLWLFCPACTQQVTPSWYASGVDSSPVAYAAIEYTNIATTADEVVTPYTQAFLPAAANVSNLRVQDVCPNDPVGHIGLAYDAGVAQMIVNALTPSQARPVPCASGWEL